MISSLWLVKVLITTEAVAPVEANVETQAPEATEAAPSAPEAKTEAAAGTSAEEAELEADRVQVEEDFWQWLQQLCCCAAAAEGRKSGEQLAANVLICHHSR